MAVGTLILDPAAVAIADRKELDLEKEGLTIRKDPGPDWGDTAIKAYVAERSYGAAMIDYTLPPRKIVIPLVVKGSAGGTSFDALRIALQAKCSRINEEGGWLRRKLPSGKIIYADLFEATLHLSKGWYTEHRDLDLEAQLEFQALPDFYGEKIDLASFEGTAAASQVTQIKGNLPGRVDFTVTEKSAVDQLGLGWHFRCQHYSSAATAGWDYQAEALTPLDAATETAVTGSSGNVIQHANLSTEWTPVMSTNLKAGTYLTHQGVYDVWVRVRSSSTIMPWLRMLYGAGDVITPAVNSQAVIPEKNNWYLVNLGQINLRAAAVGVHRWQGIIQARSAGVGGDNIAIDRLWFFCADEGSGILTADISTAPVASKYLVRDEFNQVGGPATGKSAAVGGVYSAAAGSAESDYEVIGAGVLIRSTKNDAGAPFTNLPGLKGRALGTPAETANIAFKVDFEIGVDARNSTWGAVLNYTGKANFIVVWFSFFSGQWWLQCNRGSVVGNLGQTELGANFFSGLTANGTIMCNVRKTQLTVYVATKANPTLAPRLVYEDAMVGVKGRAFIWDEEAPGVNNVRRYDNLGIWTPENNAVMYANRGARLTHQGIFRQSEDGVGMADVDRPGSDLPRIPVSGPEERPVEIAIKGSRGNFGTIPDTGLDAIKGQLSYRPCWSEIPEV